MGFRMRKSFSLGSGLRLNASMSGLSASFGGRGGGVTFGRRGVTSHMGIPGTGLSWVSSSGGGRSTGRSASPTVMVDVRIRFTDEGEVQYLDSAGNPVPESLIPKIKRQQGPAIRAFLEQAVANLNAKVESLGQIHLHTPSPDQTPTYDPVPFPKAPPPAPRLKDSGFLERFFTSLQDRREARNAALQAAHNVAFSQWTAEKHGHDLAEAAKAHRINVALLQDPSVMEEVLGEALADIVWPQETLLNLAVQEDGLSAWVSVDLPEIESFPTRTASLPATGYKVTMKAMPRARLQKLYADHVHGIALRVVGEVFATLPTVQAVTWTGYSQRATRSTGHVGDEHLLSAVVTRAAWSQLNFANLAMLDPLAAFQRFEVRRDVGKDFALGRIEPFPAPSS